MTHPDPTIPQSFIDGVKCAHPIKRMIAYSIEALPFTFLVFGIIAYSTPYGDIFMAYIENRDDPEIAAKYESWTSMMKWIILAAYVFYRSLLEWSPLQTTLSKAIFGMVVVDVNGERLTFLKALYRNVCLLFSAFFAAFGIIVAFFRDNRRSWHDNASKTYVIDRSSLPAKEL